MASYTKDSTAQSLCCHLFEVSWTTRDQSCCGTLMLLDRTLPVRILTLAPTLAKDLRTGLGAAQRLHHVLVALEARPQQPQRAQRRRLLRGACRQQQRSTLRVEWIAMLGKAAPDPARCLGNQLDRDVRAQPSVERTEERQPLRVMLRCMQSTCCVRSQTLCALPDWQGTEEFLYYTVL